MTRLFSVLVVAIAAVLACAGVAAAVLPVPYFNQRDSLWSNDDIYVDYSGGVVSAEDVSEDFTGSVDDAKIQAAFAEDKIQSLSSQTEIFVGQGFDKCEIPTLSQMQNWITNSPYGAVNLYIGGSCRSCSNPALTASYVSQLSQQGWKFIPTWVGPQSACWGGSCGSRISNDPATAYNQGISEANAAIDVAIDLGLALADGSGTIIYYDLENYDTTNTACRNAAKSFISGWTAQLHARGSEAGVYGSSCGSEISDFASISNVPDAIWPAHWIYSSYNSGATVWDVACLSNGIWGNHQRIRQYAGGHDETWGGVTLNIDCNVIDGIVASVGPADIIPLSGDLYGDGEDITGTFDPSTNAFKFKRNPYTPEKTVIFGIAGDLPVIGDWYGNDNGKDEIGVYRPDEGGQSTFYLVTRDWDSFPDGANAGAADKTIPFGYYPNNIPIAGDWDCDGDDDIGGFNPGNNNFYVYILNLGSSTATSYRDVPFGQTGDTPIIGDWDGDDDDDVGVFRQGATTNEFCLDLGLTGDQHEMGPYSLGNVGDEPLIGDWNGNGYDNLGVYRPVDGTFHPAPDLPPDTTDPTISITYPTNGQTFTTDTITVSGSASDNVALNKVEVRVGSGSWQIASGTTSWSKSVTLASGSNTIYARATDTSGNTKETSVTVTYNPPDTTDPTISITYPTNGQTFTTDTITVSGSASDNVALNKVEVRVGSGSWQIASGTTSWSKSVTLASGSNTIYARATDTSGNTKETSVTVTYNPPDTTDPTISITYPTNGQTFTTDTITVSGSASDNVALNKVEVRVGSGSWQIASGTTSWSKSVTLASGSNTIYARATDTSGNTKETSVTVTYDSAACTPPDIAWNITISATNQLEPVVVGMHPDATDGYDAEFDLFVETPAQGKVILILDDIYSTSIKKTRCYNESVSWSMSVGVPTGQTTTLSWNVPDYLNLTILEGTEILPSGSQLDEGSHELTVIAELLEFQEFGINLKAGWNMVSVPLIMNNNSVHAVFGDIPTLDTMPVKTWQSPLFIDATEIYPKVGYWVFTLTNTVITVTGTPIQNTTLYLGAGWNMVGTVGLSNLTLSDIPNQVPEKPAVTWVPPTFENTNAIEPGKSAWVFVTSGTIVPLTFGKGVSSESEAKADPMITEIRSMMAASSTDEWNLTISAVNQLEPVTFGIHPSATNGYDGYDVFSQTPVQGKVIMVLDNIYATEINKDELIWYLDVGVPTGQTTTLMWDSSMIPADVALTLNEIDMRLQTSIELGEGAHSFVINGSTRRIPGDLNHDGNVTSADVRIALDIAFSGVYLADADVDANGCVNVLDARMIMLAAAGRIEL